MNPDMEKLIQQTHKLAQSNHEMLKRIQRHQRWSRIGKFFYWAVIIFIVLGGYFYIVQPLLDRLNDAYNNFNSTVESIQSTTQSVTNAKDDASDFFQNIFRRDSAE